MVVMINGEDVVTNVVGPEVCDFDPRFPLFRTVAPGVLEEGCFRHQLCQLHSSLEILELYDGSKT